MPLPWPDDDRLDRDLLQNGDKRNVEDRYRYWTVEAIAADLAAHQPSLHIAIENWQHDFNIGTIVRNANAFNIGHVHIIGRRHWNRRGAMATEKYLRLYHHATVADFLRATEGKEIIAVDNVPGSKGLMDVSFPKNAVLVFGGEGPGLSDELLAAADMTVKIEQFGSTRSVNVGVASGIVLYEWRRQHAQAVV